MDILKWYFLLLSNWEKKIAITYFLVQIVKKNAYFTNLCFVHCWLCWYMNYFPYIDFLLKWESARSSKMDGQGLNIYKVVCWYRFRESPILSFMSLMGASWKETSSPCRLGVHGAWGFYEHPGQQLLLTWVFLKWENTTQGLCTCHQCDCSDHLDAESGPFIIQHSHKVTTMPQRDMMFISKIKLRPPWVKPKPKRISKGD